MQALDLTINQIKQDHGINISDSNTYDVAIGTNMLRAARLASSSSAEFLDALFNAASAFLIKPDHQSTPLDALNHS